MKPPDWLKVVGYEPGAAEVVVHGEVDWEAWLLDALNQACVYAFFAGLCGEAYADLTRVECACRDDDRDGPCSNEAEYLVSWSDRAPVVCSRHLQAARRWAALDGEGDREEYPRVERLLDGHLMQWAGPYPNAQVLEVPPLC